MKLEKEIILQLINKFEKSKSFSTESQRRIILKASDIKEYNKSYDRKHQVHEAIKVLLKQEFISIDWQAYEENNILEKIYLNTERLDDIYAQYNYESKYSRLEKAKADIAELERSNQQFIVPMIKDIRYCLENNKFHKFWPDDQAVRKDVTQLVLSLDELDEMTERMYSLKYFSDSKYFEKKLRSKLISILKTYDDSSLDEENILESYGIVKNPNELLIKGNIQIDIGHMLDLSIFTYGTSINQETIKHIKSVKVTSSKVITIENKAVYYEYIKTASKNELVIYLGGFFGKSTRVFLNILNRSLKGIEVFSKGFSREDLFILFGQLTIFSVNIYTGYNLGRDYIKNSYSSNLSHDYTFLKSFLKANKGKTNNV